jgi:hypothetical protein
MEGAQSPDSPFSDPARMFTRRCLILGTATILLIGLGVPIGVWLQRGYAASAAARRLQVVGVHTESLPWTAYWWRSSSSPRVTSISLGNLDVTPELARDFLALPGLQQIELRKCRIDADSVRILASLPRADLRFRECTFADPSLAGIRGQPIERLVLSGSNVSDAAGPNIGTCPELVELRIDHTRTTDTVLRSLIGLRHLHSVDASYTDASEFVIRSLFGTRVIDLNLAGTKVCDESASSFKLLPRLESVDVRDTPLTPLGIRRIRECGIQVHSTHPDDPSNY